MKSDTLQLGSRLAAALAALMLVSISGCVSTGAAPQEPVCMVERQCDSSGECVEVDPCRGEREPYRGGPMPLDDSNAMPPPFDGDEAPPMDAPY